MPIIIDRTVNFIKLIEDAKEEIMHKMPRPLPWSWESLLYARLREELHHTGALVLFILDAEYSARKDLVHANIKRQKIGEPMHNAEIDGHISSSTMWLFNTAADQLQSMVRLLVAENGSLKIIDVYSDPISPICNPDDLREGWTRVQIEKTELSRTNRLLQYAETEGSKCLGWLPIPEIHAQKLPSY